MLLLYSYSILNIFDFQYIIRDIGVVNIATVYFLDCFHHTNCHRKDNNFIHGFQHNLNPHHDKQFFPGNNSTKSYREENQSAFYPQLSFSAGLGSNYYTVSGRSESSFGSQMKNNLNKYIGFNLSVPIFNRFATRNRVRTARLQQIDLSLKLDNSKKILYKEIQQAWYNALAAESKYNSSEVAVKANEESFRLMSEKFNNGKATFVEYNEAKLNLTKALSDKLQAKYDYLFRTKILDFYKGQVIE